MYKITFVRLFRIENSFKVGYRGSNPDRGFFTREFTSVEDAVKFVKTLPLNVYVQQFHNFSNRDLRLFRYKLFATRKV